MGTPGLDGNMNNTGDSNETQHNIYRTRVYYEDTDAEGVVYYANYLKFMERARSEVLIRLGYSPLGSSRTDEVLFVVRKVEVEYLLPAKLYDELEVVTKVAKLGGASIIFHHVIRNINDTKRIFCAGLVTVICVNRHLRPHRIPASLAANLLL